MEKTQEIIAKLKQLDLSKRPHQEIKDLLGRIGGIGAIVQKLHPGKVLLRARPNEPGEKFMKVSELSYKPSQFNKTYQRASTPQNTMFYGSTISETAGVGEADTARVIGLFETVPMMRDPNSSGEKIITYSRWQVVKQIDLVAVIHHEDFGKANSYAKEQREAFKVFMAKYPDKVDKTRLANDFLSSEFAKEITPNDHDYMISAIYAEMAVEHGLAGVFYPSVRTSGDGFNVAIHPYFIDNGYLVPEFAGECTIYKRGKQTVVDNDTGALILAGQTEFEYKPIEAQYHTGKDKIMRHLYPENY